MISKKPEGPSISKFLLDNPMLVEVGRMRRSFLRAGRSDTSVKPILVFLAILYAFLILMAWMNRSPGLGMFILWLQFIVACFAVPAMAHNSIAGERERGSWDILMSTPILGSQIVLGKFIAVLGGISIGFWASLPFLLIAIVATFTGDPANGGGRSVNAEETLLLFLALQYIIVTYSVMLAALTLLFSSRVRRGVTALGIMMGLQVAWLFVIPMLEAMIGNHDWFLTHLHPVAAYDYQGRISVFRTILLGVGYLAVAFFSLIIAIRGLRKLDNASNGGKS